MKIVLEKVLSFFTNNKMISMIVGAALIVITLILTLTLSFCDSSPVTTEELTTNITTEVDNTGQNTTDTAGGTTTLPSVITVSFDSQGGSEYDSYDMAPGNPGWLPYPYRGGYDFSGWYTQPNGQGDLVDYSTFLSQSITLYAYWEVESTYTISFEVYGGHEMVDKVVNVGDASYVVLQDGAKDGYHFLGWYLNPEFTGDVYDEYISIDSDVTLYARFEMPNDVFTYEYMTHAGSGVEGYFLTSYNERFIDHTLVLPSEIDGYEIVGVAESFKITSTTEYAYKIEIQEGYLVIDDYAFSNMLYVGEIILPTTLEYIGEWSFKDTGMQSLSLEDCENLWFIGDYAFYSTGLVSVELPDLVEYIGHSSFTDCESLETFIFPDTLINPVLPSEIFRNCDSLQTLDLPSNLEVIGNYAFYYSGLTSITIPASVYCIEKEVFALSQLSSITFEDESNIQYVGGESFSWTPLVEAAPGNMVIVNNILASYGGDGVDIVLPANVKRIAERAFYRMTITNITFNSGLEEIGKEAFREVTFQNPISLPDSIKKIDQWAFYETIWSDQDLILPLNLEKLGYGSFDTARGFTYLEFQSGCPLTVIPAYAFAHTGIRTVDFGDNIEEIGPSAFYHSSSMLSITIPASVKRLGDRAIGGMYLADVIFEDFSNIEEIGCDAFTYTVWYSESLGYVVMDEYLVGYVGTDTDLTIPASVTVILAGALSHSDYTSVDLNNVVEIHDYAFVYSNSITSIHLPASLKYIGYEAFYGCDFVSGGVTWDAGFNPDYIGYYAFGDLTSTDIFSVVDAQDIVIFGDYLYWGQDCVGDIVVPSNVTKLAPYAFAFATQVTSISLPNTITEIPEWAFASLRFSSFTIPDSVVSIENNAFQYSQITSIYIPDTVVSIGEEAFYSCANLTSVTFEDPSTLQSLDNNIFRETPVYTEYLREDGFVVIDGIVFGYRGPNGALTIPEDVDYFALNFEECNYISSLYIPSHVQVFQVIPMLGTYRYLTAELVMEGTYVGNEINLDFFFGFHMDRLVIPTNAIIDEEELSNSYYTQHYTIVTPEIVLDEAHEWILKWFIYIPVIVEE